MVHSSHMQHYITLHYTILQLGVEQALDLNLTRGFEVCHTRPRTRGFEL